LTVHIFRLDLPVWGALRLFFVGVVTRYVCDVYEFVGIIDNGIPVYWILQ